MNTSKSAPWAVWAIAASVVIASFSYAFGLIGVGIEPDMNAMRFLAFSTEVFNRNLANGDVLGLLYSAFTLVTNQFLHGSPLHLGSNVLVLVLLGYPIEKVLGAKRVIGLFLLGGVIGTLVQWGVSANKPFLVFGASGGIMTVVALYQALFVNGQIRRSIGSWCLLALSVLIVVPNVLSVFGFLSAEISANAVTGVAVHLTSFVFGWLVGWYYSRYFQDTGVEETHGATLKQAAGYALSFVVAATAVSYAGGHYAPALDQRFFHYDNAELASQLKADVVKTAEALNNVLDTKEVAEVRQQLDGLYKGIDQYAQAYVYLKNSGSPAAQNADSLDTVSQIMQSLRQATPACKLLLKSVATEQKAFEEAMSKAKAAYDDGLNLPLSELEASITPVMEKMLAFNQLQALTKSVLQIASAIITPQAIDGKPITPEMEVEAVRQAIKQMLDRLAETHRQ